MTLKATTLRTLQKRVLHWYDAQARDLPWRRTRDPYRIWVSEVMLQQTRVSAVVDHYLRFLRRFPTVVALARAREEEVLAAWSGLGYYRRAGALHQAAQLVVSNHYGRLPRTASELRRLPGIGPYTAAAIASIAFNEPVAVVDGNVERVVTRLLGRSNLRSREIWAAAGELLDTHRPGDFNQAMMELGATLCTPLLPRCISCPLNRVCMTKGEHARSPRRPRQKASTALALASRNSRVRLVQRPRTNSVMPGMWELPPIKPNGHTSIFRLRHAIMDTDFDVQVYRAVPGAGKWIPHEQLSGLPLTGLARKILRMAGLLD